MTRNKTKLRERAKKWNSCHHRMDPILNKCQLKIILNIQFAHVRTNSQTKFSTSSFVLNFFSIYVRVNSDKHVHFNDNYHGKCFNESWEVIHEHECAFHAIPFPLVCVRCQSVGQFNESTYCIRVNLHVNAHLCIYANALH